MANMYVCVRLCVLWHGEAITQFVVAEDHNYMKSNKYSHYITMASCVCVCVCVYVCVYLWVCVCVCYDTVKQHHSLLWQKLFKGCIIWGRRPQIGGAEGPTYAFRRN